MPAGLTDALSLIELADLIAYVQSLRAQGNGDGPPSHSTRDPK